MDIYSDKHVPARFQVFLKKENTNDNLELSSVLSSAFTQPVS